MASVRDIARTAGFLMSGVRDFCEFEEGGLPYDHPGEGPNLLACWGQGCLELHAEVTQYAPLVAQLADDLFALAGQDFPGVWDYEVTESLGCAIAAWIVAHPQQTPAPDWVKAQLLALASDFLSQSECRYWSSVLMTVQSVFERSPISAS